MTDAIDRQKRFDGLRQRASQTLGLPLDAERVTVAAGQNLVFEALVSGFIDTGRIPDLSAYVRLSELIYATTPDPPPPKHELTLHYVNCVCPKCDYGSLDRFSVCPKCGYAMPEPPSSKPEPSPQPPASTQTPSPAAEAKPEARKPPKLPARSRSNVVEMKPRPIHDGTSA